MYVDALLISVLLFKGARAVIPCGYVLEPMVHGGNVAKAHLLGYLVIPIG